MSSQDGHEHSEGGAQQPLHVMSLEGPVAPCAIEEASPGISTTSLKEGKFWRRRPVMAGEGRCGLLG